MEAIAGGGDVEARLQDSLADAEAGLGRTLRVRIELWHAALDDRELAAAAAAAAAGWRAALGRHLDEPTAEQTLVLAGVIPPTPRRAWPRPVPERAPARAR